MLRRLWVSRLVLVLSVPVMVISLVLVLTVTGVVVALHSAFRVYAQVWDDLGEPDGCE